MQENINSDTHPKFILGNHERYLLDGRVKSAAKINKTPILNFEIKMG